MTKLEIEAALDVIGFTEDAWLSAMKPWELVSTIIVDSTYHVYLNPSNDYRFNSSTEELEVGMFNNEGNPVVKRVIPYNNIRAFSGSHVFHRGVPHSKGFR